MPGRAVTDKLIQISSQSRSQLLTAPPKGKQKRVKQSPSKPEGAQRTANGNPRATQRESEADRGTTRTVNSKDYCGDEVMMLRKRTMIAKSSTFVWFSLREKKKVYWCYCHLYDSHRTIRYSLHPTWTTDSGMASLQIMVTLSSVYQVICTNMTSSYKTINSITQLYVYACKNSVVIILVGTDRHGHDNKFNKAVDNLPSSSSNMSIIIVSSYVPPQSYRTINNSRRTRCRVAKSVISSCTWYCSHRSIIK